MTELDYVSQHNTGLDSDKPLSTTGARAWEQNAFEFKWSKWENMPRRSGFSGCPGDKVPDLHSESTPLAIFSHFVITELVDVQVYWMVLEGTVLPS